MLDLAGDQAGAAQRAGAAHHQADRLHLDGRRGWPSGLAGAGLAGGRRAARSGAWDLGAAGAAGEERR